MKYLEEVNAYLRRNGLQSMQPTTWLIDMDGTLYDSMPIHAHAWHDMIGEIGINIPVEEFFLYEGSTAASTINKIFQREYGRDATSQEVESLYHRKTELFRNTPAPPVMPGAQQLLSTLRSGICPQRTILVTGSGQGSLLDRLDTDFPGAFPADSRVTSRNVQQGKPHPEPFLKGMELAGALPTECIALDNAPLGIESAHRSGAFTIGVNTGPIPVEKLKTAGADIVFASVEELVTELPALMQALATNVGSRQYVEFVDDPTNTLSYIIEKCGATQTYIIADDNTARLVVPQLQAKCPQLSTAPVIAVASGDDNKDLTSLSAIWKALNESGATRHSLVINVGGGVVTDMGGFAAATFKRGIRFINVPTTLLSAVDAAVGGKTGINFNGFKNEIGVFAEAYAVIISTSYFDTLPTEELLSGYAEMLKHGLISGDEVYNRLLQFDITDRGQLPGLLPLLSESVNVKRQVVRKDPTERGLRRVLNLGHTVGHALESAAMHHGRPIPHGYAVAWGLVAELVLSTMRLGFASDELHRFASYVLEHYGSPTVDCTDYPELLRYMHHDKKNRNASDINCTLLSAPGAFQIDCNVSDKEMSAALDIFRDLMHI
jgi:3-dehydroquinate synthase